MGKISNAQEQATAKLIRATKVSLQHPKFADRLFRLLARQIGKQEEKRADPLRQVILDQYEEISPAFDEAAIQSSASVRGCQKAKRLAQLLITEPSRLDLTLLERAAELLGQHLYSMGPQRQHDTMRHAHMLTVLITLSRDPKLQKQLLAIRRPTGHPYAESLVRDTLGLATGTVIHDAHAQQAVLAAWLTYLRQNVGSCFATAPAEIIQGEQPEHFLRDMDELLSTGRLKRTFGGVEYSVPLSSSWGVGDLLKPFLLSHHLERVAKSPGLLLAFKAVEVVSNRKNFNWSIPTATGADGVRS